MFGFFVRRGAFDPPLTRPGGGRGGSCLPAACEYMDKMAKLGKLWRHGHYGPPGEPPPNLPLVRGGIAVLFRRHEPYTDLRELSARLGTCSSLELQECDCGAFRLSGMERRVKPFSPPKRPDFTITSAARFLRVSVSTMMRLLARGTIDGATVRVPGHPLLQGSVALREQGTRPLPRNLRKPYGYPHEDSEQSFYSLTNDLIAIDSLATP